MEVSQWQVRDLEQRIVKEAWKRLADAVHPGLLESLLELQALSTRYD